jgi:hypothetical protein
MTVAFMATATSTTPTPAAGHPTTAHPATAPIADEAPGFAVEDYNYPGADKILADDPTHTLTLKRGDGHIVLATCGSEAGLIDIAARNRSDVCFRATGTSGFLSLEIPSVFGVEGGDESAQVDLTVDNETHTYDVAPGRFTPVGESNDPSGLHRAMTLVEIRTGN